MGWVNRKKDIEGEKCIVKWEYTGVRSRRLPGIVRWSNELRKWTRKIRIFFFFWLVGLCFLWVLLMLLLVVCFVLLLFFRKCKWKKWGVGIPHTDKFQEAMALENEWLILNRKREVKELRVRISAESSCQYWVTSH